MAWRRTRESSIKEAGAGKKNSNTKDEILSLGRYKRERKEYEEGEEEDVFNFLYYVHKNCALARRISQNVI